MRAFDARCEGCGDVHILWLPSGHTSGETIKHAHVDKLGACGEYAEHELVASLDGLDHTEKWGPEAA